MNYKNRLIAGFFSIAAVFILSFAFVWDRTLKLDQCERWKGEITDISGRQDDLLFNYGLYAEISKDEIRTAAFRKYIEIREPLAKKKIENYAKQCRTSYNKGQLLSMLSHYDLYLRTKRLLFKEDQTAGMHWLRGVTPFDDGLSL